MSRARTGAAPRGAAGRRHRKVDAVRAALHVQVPPGGRPDPPQVHPGGRPDPPAHARSEAEQRAAVPTTVDPAPSVLAVRTAPTPALAVMTRDVLPRAARRGVLRGRVVLRGRGALPPGVVVATRPAGTSGLLGARHGTRRRIARGGRRRPGPAGVSVPAVAHAPRLRVVQRGRSARAGAPARSAPRQAERGRTERPAMRVGRAIGSLVAGVASAVTAAGTSAAAELLGSARQIAR